MWFILPFFLVAPVGLMAAGMFALRSGVEVFVVVNARSSVAITHALVLGWVSTVMMGAVYQLGPVVLGGALRSTKLVPVNLVFHAVAVGSFVTALTWPREWWIGATGSLLFISVAIFVFNAGHALWRAPAWSLPRAYLLVSTAALGLTAMLGITFAINIENQWFQVTPGRLAAHAHLGLVGWLALTVMGVSYQLVPMFNVASRVRPRLAFPALFLTSGALLLFAATIWTDPPREVRVLIALLLVLGPALWAIDQARIIGGRAKRKIDIHGLGTLVSLAFLGITIVLGLGAAWGTPFGTADEPARWPIAYVAAGVLGWAGTAILANSFKIVPFLVWYHRYRPRIGHEPVPLIRDIYDERAARALLALHSVATVVVVPAALTGSVVLLHAGALLLVASGAVHLVNMLAMLLPKRSSRAAEPATEGTRP